VVVQRVLVLGAASPAAVAAATRLALSGAALTVVDEDLSAADRWVEALREQGCTARVEAVAPTDPGALESLVGDHEIVIDTAMSPSSATHLWGGATASQIAYVRVRSAAVAAADTSVIGFRAFVEVTFTPVPDGEPEMLQPLLSALGGAMVDRRFTGHLRIHASS
jgi:hypothetical protein